jgi:hypothetical protein
MATLIECEMLCGTHCSGVIEPLLVARTHVSPVTITRRRRRDCPGPVAVLSVFLLTRIVRCSGVIPAYPYRPLYIDLWSLGERQLLPIFSYLVAVSRTYSSRTDVEYWITTI